MTTPHSAPITVGSSEAGVVGRVNLSAASDVSYFLNPSDTVAVGTVVADAYGKNMWRSNVMPSAVWIVYYVPSKKCAPAQLIAIVPTVDEAIAIEKKVFDHETAQGWDHQALKHVEMPWPNLDNVTGGVDGPLILD